VIFPLFNGQDLNNMPELRPYRWVIYFRDWPKERARKYAPAFRRVEELVRPYREALTGQIHQTCFWKFWDLRQRLSTEMDGRDWILASAITAKYLCFRFLPTSNIYSKATKLYFMSSWEEFACLQSSIHAVWAYWRCGKMGTSRIKYSTSEALETWPMPMQMAGAALGLAGESFHSLRNEFLINTSVGLTEFYNHFHDQNDRDPKIGELRSHFRQMDEAVVRAYGWGDLELAHGFHEVPYLPSDDCIRFTVSETARSAVIRRLLTLNHERRAEEVAAGLHSGGRKK